MRRNKSFGDFVDKKKRDSIHQLNLIRQMLEAQGMKVDNFLENAEEEPYIFAFNPSRNGSFDGLRIYKIGDIISFRIQKENKTHPYGAAYAMPIEDMFQDFMSDEDIDEVEAGKKVMESVAKEIKKFFDKSVEAERDERDQMIDDSGGAGSVLVKTTGTDYSSLVYSKS